MKNFKSTIPSILQYTIEALDGEIIKMNSIISLLFNLLKIPHFVDQIDFNVNELQSNKFENVQSGEWFKKNSIFI